MKRVKNLIDTRKNKVIFVYILQLKKCIVIGNVIVKLKVYYIHHNLCSKLTSR